MVAVFDNNREAIEALCTRYGVVRMDVFGSVLRELVGVEVDLVMVGAVKNPYIAADIERTKQLLHAA